MKRTVYGVGYFGKGKYVGSIGGRKTAAYRSWQSMFTRCYCPLSQIEKPTYLGCEVHPCWHNFQDFAEWYYNQDCCDMGYELDKDIICKGNKIYSPDLCCLVPRELNALLTNNKASRGLYPIGVNFRKTTGRYEVRVCEHGTRNHVGMFDSIEDAFLAYKSAKERYIRSIAMKYVGVLPDAAFQSLMRMEITYDD